MDGTSKGRNAGKSPCEHKERIKTLDFTYAVRQHHINLPNYRKIVAITESTEELYVRRKQHDKSDTKISFVSASRQTNSLSEFGYCRSRRSTITPPASAELGIDCALTVAGS
jgi:hypothetical protein